MGEQGSVDIASGHEPWLLRDLRRIATVATLGLALGVVINGWGSRGVMMLLARVNPQATGRISDDGFVIGRFDLASTMGLVALGAAIGVFGGLLFLAVRQLRFGPAWFRTASITIGPAVVVGALLVHTDGIDFTLLGPTWLTVGSFVALPGLFAYAMATTGDRWLTDDGWFLTGARWKLLGLVPLGLVVPLAPLLAVLAAPWLAYRLVPPLQAATVRRVAAGIARAALLILFVVALGNLVSDIAVLT